MLLNTTHLLIYYACFLEDPSRYLLPTAIGNQTVCPAPETDCFLAGDVRVNLQEALATVHHLWFREHNRIAKRIAELNGGYSSDQVFQVARQILIAELQKIVYKDYLPIILGSAYSQMSTYKGYNPAINPSVANSYDAAAGRFGHSMVQPFFERLGVNYTQVPEGPLILAGSFFNTSSIRTYGVDVMARGLVHNESRIVDRFFTSTLSHQLFTSKPTDPGMDLISINLQRGRDHGLPPYVTWKKWAMTTCNLSSDFVNSSTVEQLFVEVYGSLDSVDLYAGSVSEQHVNGGLVGATFACIFIQNYATIRDADRFYYENVLTTAQIQEINANASISRVVCDNTDISTIQRDAFRLGAARVDCTSIPSVNLDLWGPAKAAEKSPVHGEETEAAESLGEEVMRFVNGDAEAKKELSMALMEEVLREIKSRG
jgi:peroxidase